jgi:hypothetical protein
MVDAKVAAVTQGGTGSAWDGNTAQSFLHGLTLHPRYIVVDD